VELNPSRTSSTRIRYPPIDGYGHAPLYRNDSLSSGRVRYRDVFDASLDWEVYSSAEGTTLERVDARLFETRP